MVGAIIVILILVAAWMNGWNVAPSAIATSVATRSIKPQKALWLSSFFNCVGLVTMTFVSARIVETLYRMVNLGSDSTIALLALIGGLLAMIFWIFISGRFAIPSSQSHALIAGVSGAAIAVQKGLARY